MTAKPSRRRLLAGTAALLGRRAFAASPPVPPLTLPFERPLRIKALQVLQVEGDYIVRATTQDGATGHAILNQHASFLHPFFKERVAPFFVGKDARDLPSLIDQVLIYASNYKMVGVPFWCAVSWADFALLDLLGHEMGKPVGALFGGARLRRRVPMYLSSTDRSSTPEEEVALFEAALAHTGARAVKFKVGGRMSGNADAAPRRTETLVALLRKRLGDRITLYADANGSFDVKKGIEVGRLLESHGVAIYEEPCPFEDYAATAQVTKALTKVLVAGGEQDTSAQRWKEIVAGRILDLVQPDLSYNGGFLRTLRVAQMAAAARLPISPHCPQASTMLYTLQLCAFTPNLGPYQEFHVHLVNKAPWYAPNLALKDGMLEIPETPGLGLTLDPERLARARPV